MRIDRIELTNFLSHRKTMLDISHVNPVVIVGKNGAGKSTLVKDSITWCLFGKARAGNDEIIHNLESFAEVRIRFQVNEKAYEVIRYRERKKRTTLAVFAGEIELTGATIAETQAIIEKILGVNYETFVATVCIEQGKADSFSVLTPKEAKTIIMNILQLGVYGIYFNLAKEKANHFAGELIRKEGEQQVEQGKLEALQSSVEELQHYRGNVLHSEKLRSKYQTDIREIETNIYRLEGELNTQLGESSRLTLYVSQLREAQAVVEGKLAKIQKAKDRGKCPLCLSQLTSEGIHIIIDEFNKRHTKYKVELEKSEEKLRGICLKQTASLSMCKRLRVQKEQSQEGMEQATQQLREAEGQAGFLSAKEIELSEVKERLSKVTLQVKKIMRVQSQYATLTRAFDKHGIPTLVIENVIPEIEESTNRILAILSDTMQLELRTQKTLKTGGVGDTLEIIIKSLTTERSYGMLSGGEQMRVNLALRIALSMVLARRNNFKVGTLLIDEGFGSLDEIGKEKFVELTNSLHNTFERIILITHTDLIEHYDNILTVRKVNGISQIDQVQPVSSPS